MSLLKNHCVRKFKTSLHGSCESKQKILPTPLFTSGQAVCKSFLVPGSSNWTKLALRMWWNWFYCTVAENILTKALVWKAYEMVGVSGMNCLIFKMDAQKTLKLVFSSSFFFFLFLSFSETFFGSHFFQPSLCQFGRSRKSSPKLKDFLKVFSSNISCFLSSRESFVYFANLDLGKARFCVLVQKASEFESGGSSRVVFEISCFLTRLAHNGTQKTDTKLKLTNLIILFHFVQIWSFFQLLCAYANFSVMNFCSLRN